MTIDGDLELLRLGAETLFSFDARGRIVRVNSPANGPAPRFYLAGCPGSNILYLRDDVGDDTAATIRRLVAEEPPLREPGSDAVHIEQYRWLLGVGELADRELAGPHLDFRTGSTAGDCRSADSV